MHVLNVVCCVYFAWVYYITNFSKLQMRIVKYRINDESYGLLSKIFVIVISKITRDISFQSHLLMQLFKMQQSFKISTWKWKDYWIKILEKGNATFRKSPSTTRGAYTTKTLPQKIHGNWFISSYYSVSIKLIISWNSVYQWRFNN